MTDPESTAIIPGISISSSGEATVDSSLHETLFDLAISIEEVTDLPVDVQHIVGAIVLAARERAIDTTKPPSANDPSVVKVLTQYVKTIFGQFEGELGNED